MPKSYLIRQALITFILLFSTFFVSVSFGDKVAMKIVAEPVVNYNNMNNAAAANTAAVPTTVAAGANSYSKLEAKVLPAAFSGPEALRPLDGLCFSKSDNGYRYEVCPFRNSTQFEISTRWNPYSGILGVFEKWMLRSDRYVAQIFSHGDNCSKGNRQVSMYIQCGSENALVDVKEPETCRYRMLLQTPLICNISLDVQSELYECGLQNNASLPSNILSEFDRIDAEEMEGLLTRKGVLQAKIHTLNEAKFCNPFNVRRKPTPEEIEKEYRSSCDTCKEERQSLLNQIKDLQVQLDELHARMKSFSIQPEHNTTNVDSDNKNDV